MSSRWLNRALFLLLVGGAMVLAGGVANASVGDGSLDGHDSTGIEQEQTGSNRNQTDQNANAYAVTYQVNVNMPIAILSPGSNDGDFSQSNDATTIAGAQNGNETDQSVDQAQDASTTGMDTWTCDCGDRSGIDQDQEGSNDNRTDQDAGAKAETKQVNVNAPIAILSPGSNEGDVTQSNDATTIAVAQNTNGTDQAVDQDQQATSGGGGCGSCGGGIDQSQEASNSNQTNQDADADARTDQENINAPFTSDGRDPGCGCGAGGSDDVVQSNDAATVAGAANDNSTAQAIDQAQRADAKGSRAGSGDHAVGCGCRPEPPPVGCGCTPHPNPGLHRVGGIEPSQEARNQNGTDQDSHADATTEQSNRNEPHRPSMHPKDGCGCGSGSGGGDVSQWNGAFTGAFAGNGNWTGQAIRQAQDAES